MNENERKVVVQRMLLLIAVACIIMGLYTFRLIFLQLVNGDSFKAKATNTTDYKFTVTAARGGDRELIIRGVGGFCLETVPVDQLQKDQPEGVQPHDDAGHCDEQQHPLHHDLAFIFVHLVLLLRVRPHRCRS